MRVERISKFRAGLVDITHTSRSCISWWTHRRELFEETPLSVLGRITVSCSQHHFLETSVFSKKPLERRVCFHRRSSWVIAIWLLQFTEYTSQITFTAFFWTKNSRTQGEGEAISKLDSGFKSDLCWIKFSKSLEVENVFDLLALMMTAHRHHLKHELETLLDHQQ